MSEKSLFKEEAELFSYEFSGTRERVFIYWQGRCIKTLKNKEATKFMDKVEMASSGEAQRIMAKATNNFRRGNEKGGKLSPKAE